MDFLITRNPIDFLAEKEVLWLFREKKRNPIDFSEKKRNSMDFPKTSIRIYG